MKDNARISHIPLLSNSRLVQARGNGHTYTHTHVRTHTWTRAHTQGLCFIASGIWGKVSGLSLVYLWLCTQASLSSLFVPLSFPASVLLIPVLHASLLSRSSLNLLVFLSVGPLSSSFLYPPSSLTSLSPSTLLLFFSTRSQLSPSFSGASNSHSLLCFPLTSHCNNKLRTNSMYISLFPLPDNSIHFSQALHSE